MRVGKRLQDKQKAKETKQHIKSFHKIINTINTEITPKLDPTIDYTEENINEYVNPLLGRDLDSVEKFLVLGKMHYKKEELKQRKEENE